MIEFDFPPLVGVQFELGHCDSCGQVLIVKNGVIDMPGSRFTVHRAPVSGRPVLTAHRLDCQPDPDGLDADCPCGRAGEPHTRRRHQ